MERTKTPGSTVKPAKKKKRISVQSAKAKGRGLQQWACQKISDLTGLPWGADQPIESRGMGQNGTDVRLDSAALKLFPYSVECKFQESWSIPAWIEQAKKNVIKNTNWILVCKRSKKSPVVIIDADVFFQILEKCSKK